jgi:hypothetical protein
MATTITAGNATNGAAISSDGTGILDIKTGTGAGTTAISIDASQAVTMPGNLVVTGTITNPSLGGGYVLTSYTSPTTWAKPTGLKAVKVTVIGGGGTGGGVPATPIAQAAGGGGGGGGSITYLSAPSIPGPVTVTAGAGTNSFGGFLSATGGASGGQTGNPPTASPGGAAGTGSGGLINASGTSGLTGTAQPAGSTGGNGGNAALFYGIFGAVGTPTTGANGNPAPATNYGAGGAGAAKGTPTTAARTGGTGGPGIVIIEEFY